MQSAIKFVPVFQCDDIIMANQVALGIDSLTAVFAVSSILHDFSFSS